MLICKEIRVERLEESLSGRISHYQLQTCFLLLAMTIWGQVPVGAKVQWIMRLGYLWHQVLQIPLQ
jgi:hypothetical protein